MTGDGLAMRNAVLMLSLLLVGETESADAVGVIVSLKQSFGRESTSPSLTA